MNFPLASYFALLYVRFLKYQLLILMKKEQSIMQVKYFKQIRSVQDLFLMFPSTFQTFLIKERFFAQIQFLSKIDGFLLETMRIKLLGLFVIVLARGH